MLRQASWPTATPVRDRRLDLRYVGPVNGCYTLSERREAADGEVAVYACRTQSISCSAAAVTAPVIGDVGEWLTARFDGLGIVRGQIDRHITDGFVFQIQAGTDEQRLKLAMKIDFLRKKSTRKEQDKRSFSRLQPRDPRSTLAVPGGEVTKCFVIDFSRSGAAVSAQLKPEIGTPVVVGTLASHVVRHLEVGFAVKFDAAQDTEGLEQLVTGYDADREMAAPFEVAGNG